MTRFPLQPLLARLAGVRDACDLLGISGRTRKHLLLVGLTVSQADAYAARVGFHPSEIWSDWYDHDDPEPICRGCGQSFVPTSTQQLYCDHRCRWRTKERDRRARLKAAP